jgi:hypothetical protein
VGDNYIAKLVAAGGTPPYRWRLVGAPPRGIHVLVDGRIHGTPTNAGSRTFNATVTDALGVSANVRLQIVVAS